MTIEQALRQVVRDYKNITVLFRDNLVKEVLVRDSSLERECKLLQTAFEGETILKIKSLFENVYIYNEMKKDGYQMFDEEEIEVANFFFRAFYFPDFRPEEFSQEIKSESYNYKDHFQGVFEEGSITGVGVCHRYDRLDHDRLIQVFKGAWLDGMLFGYCEIEDTYHDFDPCTRYAMMSYGYALGTETIIGEDGYIRQVDHNFD